MSLIVCLSILSCLLSPLSSLLCPCVLLHASYAPSFTLSISFFFSLIFSLLKLCLCLLLHASPAPSFFSLSILSISIYLSIDLTSQDTLLFLGNILKSQAPVFFALFERVSLSLSLSALSLFYLFVFACLCLSLRFLGSARHARPRAGRGVADDAAAETERPRGWRGGHGGRVVVGGVPAQGPRSWRRGAEEAAARTITQRCDGRDWRDGWPGGATHVRRRGGSAGSARRHDGRPRARLLNGAAGFAASRWARPGRGRAARLEGPCCGSARLARRPEGAAAQQAGSTRCAPARHLGRPASRWARPASARLARGARRRCGAAGGTRAAA